MILKVVFANSGDPDQTALLIRVHTVYLYAKIGLKSLQEYSANDVNRRHVPMQIFLALYGLGINNIDVTYLPFILLSLLLNNNLLNRIPTMFLNESF